MSEILTILQGFTPGAYGIWTGVLMFAGWFLKEWRETRKLTAEDRLARRDGYAKQVESLTAENRALRREMQDTRQQSEDDRRACNQENDALRCSLRRVLDELAGLKLAIISGEITAFRTLPHDFITDASAKAADRANEILTKENDLDRPQSDI